jgi:hypothetical protein
MIPPVWGGLAVTPLFPALRPAAARFNLDTAKLIISKMPVPGRILCSPPMIYFTVLNNGCRLFLNKWFTWLGAVAGSGFHPAPMAMKFKDYTVKNNLPRYCWYW